MTNDTRADELRRLDLQLSGLVYARSVREREGASGEELRRYSEEIARQRRRLAERGARAAA